MLRKGTKITFRQMSDFTGKMMVFGGRIIGHAEELRKKFPVELEEAINPVYLVRRSDPYGNLFFHCVYDEEIVEKKSTSE